MSDPKFKAGDPVQYEGTGEVVKIIQGPIAPLRLRAGDAYFLINPDDYCYVLDSGPPRRRVVPESRLTRAEQWERCPGRHRWADTKPCSTQWDNMERLVE